MKPTIERDEDWETIVAKLPRNWRELADAHGIVKHTGRGSTGKVRDAAIVLRVILHHVCAGAALKTTVALAAAIGLIEVSAASLHKWMRKCGDWLADLVREMVGSTEKFAPQRWGGYEVTAADATTVQRPGAKETTARVHFAMRLFDLRPAGIKITDVHVGETLRNFVIKAGQLWIADRGYCNAGSIAHAVRAGADVLIRFAFGPLPLFDQAGRPIDARALTRRAGKPGRSREWAAWVHPKGQEPIKGRLVVVRLPPDGVTKARERLDREYKKSEQTELLLEMTNYVVLFTTVPKDRLGADLMIELYRLRWQIELDFKRDKSIAGLDDLPNKLPETVHTWICAKMLGLALARRLAEPGEPFPPSVVGFYALRVRMSHLRARATEHHA